MSTISDPTLTVAQDLCFKTYSDAKAVSDIVKAKSLESDISLSEICNEYIRITGNDFYISGTLNAYGYFKNTLHNIKPIREKGFGYYLSFPKAEKIRDSIVY